jgi:hypothetical protein
MTDKQLLTLLRPLKRKEDGAMPNAKCQMIEALVAWCDRPPLTFDAGVNEPVCGEDAPGLVEATGDEDEAAAAAAAAMMTMFQADVV